MNQAYSGRRREAARICMTRQAAKAQRGILPVSSIQVAGVEAVHHSWRSKWNATAPRLKWRMGECRTHPRSTSGIHVYRPRAKAYWVATLADEAN